MKKLLFLLLPLYCFGQHHTNAKFPMNADGYYANQQISDPTPLFDGDTVNYYNPTPGGVPGTIMEIRYTFPAGYNFQLRSIRIYNKDFGQFTPHTMVYMKRSDNFQEILLDSFYNQVTMTFKNMVASGPYPTFQIILRNSSASIRYGTELACYGDYDDFTESNGTPHAPSFLANTSGANGYSWNIQQDPNNPGSASGVYYPKANRFAQLNGIRIYQDWHYFEPHRQMYALSPVFGGWLPDSVYGFCHRNGMFVDLVIQGNTTWMRTTYGNGLDSSDFGAYHDYMPVMAANSTHLEDPASYIELGQMGWVAAARWGRNSNIDTTKWTVWDRSEQPWQPAENKKVGLGYVDAIEPHNEKDQNWAGGLKYGDGRQFGAELSTFADGDMGRLGPGVGVWTADSTMQVWQGGLATADPLFLRGIVDWSIEHRGFKDSAHTIVNIPLNAINYHLYSTNDIHSQFGGASKGMCPEMSGVYDVAKKFKHTVEKYANNIPIIISELGNDTTSGSVMGAFQISSKSALNVQADWYMRSALLYSTCIDRLLWFQFTDNVVGNSHLIKQATTLTNGAWTRLTLDNNANFHVGSFTTDFFYYDILNAGTARDMNMPAYAVSGSSTDIMVQNNSGANVTTVFNDKATGPYAMWQQFNNMGFINNLDPGYTRRPSFDYLVQLDSLMGPYKYTDSSFTTSSVKVFRYTKTGANDIYAVWSPTQNGTTGTVNMSLATGLNVITHAPVVGASVMSSSNSTVPSGGLNVSFSETPVFIEVPRAAVSRIYLLIRTRGRFKKG